MIKAIIFDLDGTLYPRTGSLYQSMSALIRQWFQRQLRMSDSDFDDYYEQMKFVHPSPLGAIHALGLNVASFHHEVFGMLDPKAHLVPDENLRRMLEGLSAKKFVVTLASREHVINVLEALGAGFCFSGVIVPGKEWATTVKLDAYETIRQKGGWEREEICVVGDDPRIDILEACAAGYRCVAVSGDAQGPDIAHVESIYELEAVVQASLGKTKTERSVNQMNEQAIQQLHAAFSRTTEEVFSMNEWDDLLRSGKQLRIKYGIDVTAPFLHIGHAVNLWMMRKLQDLGHKVIFLVGDFTTQIGDPTGKSKTRPVIPLEEIERNTSQFIEQAKMVLRFDDPNLLEIRRNSEWYGKMALSEFLKLMSLVTHSRLISRDMFQKRIAESADIYMHELVYPILQGYDSFMLNSDLTIIGTDQLFNEMMGRFYQEKFGQRSQVILTTKITPGIHGVAKQSKSLDNYIGLGHSPRDKFGRTMRLPDALIATYFRVYTEVTEPELRKLDAMIKSDPLEAKKLLAMEIVKRYHGEKAAQSEREWFDHTFSRRQIPLDAPTVTVEAKAVPALEIVKQFFSGRKGNAEIRRLFQQGGVTINDHKVTNPLEQIEPSDGDTVQVGKRIWFRLHLKEEE